MRDVHGEVLLLLNQLQGISPDVYERKVVKDAGRKRLRHELVASLDCHWDDVLVLSPVHPGRLLDVV